MTVQPVVNYQNAIPRNTFYVDERSKKNEYMKDNHITNISDASVTADKLANNVVYAINGLKGSKNSNFYQFLSLGMVPYLVGSAMLIALFNAVNRVIKKPYSNMKASRVGFAMGAGVVLYGLGKCLGSELVDLGVKLTTGVDLDMPYKKIVKNLPEYAGDPNPNTVEYHKVFESVDFPYWQMIEKKGIMEGDRFKYYDDFAKRLGYKEKLNSPEQVVQPAILEVVTRADATKAILPFLWAATGVAIAQQSAYQDLANWFIHKPKGGRKLEKWLNFPKLFVSRTVEAVEQLWKGREMNTGGAYRYNKAAGIVGKILITSSVATLVLGVFSAAFGMYKKKPQTNIDLSKSYREC